MLTVPIFIKKGSLIFRSNAINIKRDKIPKNLFSRPFLNKIKLEYATKPANRQLSTKPIENINLI